MALINIEKDGTTYSVNTQNVTYIAKFDEQTQTFQVFIDGYDNAFTITEAKYQEFLSADYSGGGGGGQGGIQSNTIQRMEFDGDKTLTINNIPFEGGGGSNMVYNTETGVLSGAKDQTGADVTFEVGTITIQF